MLERAAGNDAIDSAEAALTLARTANKEELVRETHVLLAELHRAAADFALPPRAPAVLMPSTAIVTAADGTFSQVAKVTVFLTDLVQYWVHRAFHRIPWLWGFHSVHHSARSMDWMASASAARLSAARSIC